MFSSEALRVCKCALVSQRERVDDVSNMSVVAPGDKAEVPWRRLSYNSDWPGVLPRKGNPEILDRYVITLSAVMIKARVTDYASSQEALVEQGESQQISMVGRKERLAASASR